MYREAATRLWRLDAKQRSWNLQRRPPLQVHQVQIDETVGEKQDTAV
jgi:hypothetical protein